jgi:hypothetical protein
MNDPKDHDIRTRLAVQQQVIPDRKEASARPQLVACAA